ncbi:PilZ domain-containing protein [Psychrobacillus sp. INOP01]|uniref:PilZ domain-containing protein n=1 Tax=Psychrobacillus sp. INOP01 TaxID=2829187 RepID=UPI001BA8DD81|nr:PilZ domain-containing protein [Psychrobacillus sp. INOP01]QUG40819.1 PilZ domain-containing protein [Psychrobacillus sp. INOP01]
MKYNRNEYFRYTFGEPCDATFRLIKQRDGNAEVELSKKGVCKIIDISPNGLKMFSELFISIDQLNHVELNFTLDTNPISMVGEFVWSHRKAFGHEYGVKLVGDSESESMIIEELKKRSRKEMELKK